MGPRQEAAAVAAHPQQGRAHGRTDFGCV